MKRIFFLTAVNFVVLTIAYSQPIPPIIEQRLQAIQNDARIRLDEFQISGGRGLPQHNLRGLFHSDEIGLVESLGLELNMGMVFDDAMRDRIVQLMRGEFREDELDTLVNRFINRDHRQMTFERKAIRIPQIDTLSIFIEARNSLYDSLEAEDPWNINKRRRGAHDLEVFKSLQLDTLSVFKQAFNEIVERGREREREREAFDKPSSHQYDFSWTGRSHWR